MSDNKKLKPGWKVWRFDQMATNVNVRIDNPSESGMKHYVGLEHLDVDSLKIRRWGTPDDVEATKLMFKRGDIIFGRRRAYQRKLGVAEFDGICSAHAMVLRAKPDVVLPEFLPCFMQSDLFMNRAVEISVGSLSPTINWKTMAAQEFALPPIEEQSGLVDALTALNETANCISNLVSECNSLYLASLDHMLGLTGLPPRALQSDNTEIKFPVLKLQDVIDQSRPISYGILQPGKEDDDGIPMLRTMDFDDLGRREKTKFFKVTVSVEKTSSSTRLRGGELLISVMATIGRTYVVPDSMAGSNVNRALAVIAPQKNKISAEYLEAFFHSRYARQTLEADKIGSAQLRINLEQLRNMRLPVPSEAEQQEIITLRSSLKHNIAEAEARLLSLGQLRKVFFGEVLANVY